jgi:hypothetical protein
MPTNKISGSILKFLDDFFLLSSRHSESNIGDDKARDISVGKEPTLVHASSKEVERGPSNKGVIYIEEGCSFGGECHVTTLAIGALFQRFMLTP